MQTDFENGRPKGTLLRITLACILAELLNLLCVWFFCDQLHAHLFLDTVGTVAVTFYAGLVPGLIVAVMFNIMRVLMLAIVTKSPVYPWDMIYALCGIAIVLTTWSCSRKKENFCMDTGITLLHLVLIALVSAFASSIIGGIIESFNRIMFQGKAYDARPLEQMVHALLGENLGLFASCIMARIPVTVLDRFICTFAGFGLYRLTQLDKKQAHGPSLR